MIEFEIAPLGMGDPLYILERIIKWVIRNIRKVRLKFRNFLTNNHATQKETLQNNAQIRKTENHNQTGQTRIHESLHENLHEKETENAEVKVRKEGEKA